MGLNASAAFSFLNLNNPYLNLNNNQNSTQTTSDQTSIPNDTAGTLGANDSTYNMPSGSIYDTAGSIAYNYYNTSFSSNSSAPETTGSIASAETTGSVASSGGTASSSGVSVSSSVSVASSGGSSGGSSSSAV